VAFSYGRAAAAPRGGRGGPAPRAPGVTGPADARVPGEIAAFVDEARALGGCDFLVNNVVSSGGFPRRDERGGLDEAFDVNVKAAVMASARPCRTCGAAGRGDRERGELGGSGLALPPRLLRLEGGAGDGDGCLALALAPQVRVNAWRRDPRPARADEAVGRRIPAGRFGPTARRWRRSSSCWPGKLHDGRGAQGGRRTLAGLSAARTTYLFIRSRKSSAR